MTKSQLIAWLFDKQPKLDYEDVELAVKDVLEYISSSLSNGKRVEIRGFGSFSLRHRQSRSGRNPKTGETVYLLDKYIPYFKAGKRMRDRINIYSDS